MSLALNETIPTANKNPMNVTPSMEKSKSERNLICFKFIISSLFFDYYDKNENLLPLLSLEVK
jgi:hypothetical protein